MSAFRPSLPCKWYALSRHARCTAGLNTGSMLLRNSEWTRRLLGEMCAHAHREDLDAMRMVHFQSL